MSSDMRNIMTAKNKLNVYKVILSEINFCGRLIMRTHLASTINKAVTIDKPIKVIIISIIMQGVMENYKGIMLCSRPQE